MIANAFGFSVTAFVTGVITTALGQALESFPGFPSFFAYVTFFVVLPIAGFYSDVSEMIVRGLIFIVFVAIFSNYVLNDPGEVAAAFVAFVISLLISIWNEFSL